MKIEEVLKIIKPALNKKYKYVAMIPSGIFCLYTHKPKFNGVYFYIVKGEYDTLSIDALNIDKKEGFKKILIRIKDIK